jgi:hypothetical protein
MGTIVSKRFRSLFFDLISFGSSQAIVLNLIFILLFLFIFPTNSFENFPIKSLYSGLIIPHFFAEGCSFSNCGFYSIGQTRGLSRLLHGDFIGAGEYNKLVFILFLWLVVVLINNLYKSYKSYKKTGKIFPW